MAATVDGEEGSDVDYDDESDYEDEPLEPTLQNLVDQESLRWIFVGGKGGVGKTTTSCSLAVMLAQQRGKVLIISTDPAHNLSDAFGQPFGAKETQVVGIPNLFAMEVDPKANMAAMESSLSALNEPGSASTASQAELLSRLSTSIPGIDEAIAFNELMNQIKSKDFDVIVFDTAPTGHTLRLLGFPDALESAMEMATKMKDKFGGMFSTVSKLFKGGPFGGGGGSGSSDPTSSMADELFGTAGLSGGASGAGGMPDPAGLAGLLDSDKLSKKLQETSDSVKLIKEQFCDPSRTTFVCVCIPEFLSLYETERLVFELAKIGMDTHNIVINQVLFPEDGSQCSRCLSRVKMQEMYINQFYDLYPDFNLIKMPQLCSEVRHVSKLQHFAYLLLHPYSEMTREEKERFLRFERTDEEKQNEIDVSSAGVIAPPPPGLTEPSLTSSTIDPNPNPSSSSIVDDSMIDVD